MTVNARRSSASTRRGASEAITDAIDAHVEAGQADDEDGDAGSGGVLVPAG
jgi:hypothetical protein